MPLVKRAPAGGLPARVYVPIVAISVLVVVAIVAYFLKAALVTSGSVLGPGAQGPQAPAGARDKVLGGSQPVAAPTSGPSAKPRPLVTGAR